MDFCLSSWNMYHVVFGMELSLTRKTRHVNVFFVLFMRYSNEQLTIITQSCEGSSYYMHMNLFETKLDVNCRIFNWIVKITSYVLKVHFRTCFFKSCFSMINNRFIDISITIQSTAHQRHVNRFLLYNQLNE